MAKILPVSLVLLIMSAISRLSQAKKIPGDNWCGDLMCVTAFVNTSTITYQMTSLNQLGWIAMGFGTVMADSKMVIMWPNTDQSVTLSQRTATGTVEPDPDPNPPRAATLYQPLTILNSVRPTLSFTVTKDSTVMQDVIWAFSFENPNTTDPNALTLVQHVDSGNFVLNLTNMIDTDDLPSQSPSQSVLSPTSFSTAIPPEASSPTSSPTQSEGESGGGPPLETFEKLIIAHAVLAVTGFLIILPLGAMFARWGRTFTDRWFYYHWTAQVVLSIPLVVIGWTLGPLAVAEQGVAHANDAHKICGILLFPLYIMQLCLGAFIHFRKPPYPTRHPPQNFVHAGLGILIIGLAFFQTRTGLTVEWRRVTSRPIDLRIFSNLWIAWVVLVPAAYFLGCVLIPRQLKQERELPPPYSPRDSSPGRSSPIGVRRLLGLEPEDDGTHDAFSESASQARTTTASTTTDLNSIEMREVSTHHLTPMGVASSR